MNHADVRRKLGLYLDGQLTLADRARLDGHLDQCERCTHELWELRETVRLVRDLPDPAPPPGLVAGVVAAASEVRRPAARPSAWWAAPALAVLVAAGLWVFASQGGGGVGQESVDPALVSAPTAARPGERTLGASRAPGRVAPSNAAPSSAGLEDIDRALGLALRDPAAFVSVWREQSTPGAARWLAQVAAAARAASVSDEVRRRLVGLETPEARRLARSFEATAER